MAKKSAESGPGDASYEAHKKRSAAKQAEQSAAGRDIAPLPEVADADRKLACMMSLRLFCETYLGDWFFLGWSEVHLRAIDRLEKAVLDGEMYAFAMPRGSGKTALAIAAALWAILYGHRQFVVMIGATETHAEEMLDDFKAQCETNELFLEDFPEVVYPIHRLEGINHRAAAQTFEGERTRLQWSGKVAVMPTLPGSQASGSTVWVAGLTGRIRGMKRSIGKKIVRPDCVIIDDPQTDDSAQSPVQNDTRERVLTGAILGLAGPKVKIAAVMPCTVIAANDMADRILDPDRNPQWHGERSSMVLSFPADEQRWDEYYRIRFEDLQGGGSGGLATNYYAANRENMDRGGAVYWEHRFNPGELSALQSAMNLKQDRPRVFWAEFQNRPASTAEATSAKYLTSSSVMGRLSGVSRCEVPRESSRVSAFVDVGGKILWYAVVAWNERFGGSVIDYGTWPRQTRANFAASDAKPALIDVYPGRSEPQLVYAGLKDLLAEILGKPYFRDGKGDELKIDRCLVDSGWQPQAVYQAIRSSPFAAQCYPSKGIGRSTTSRGVGEWKPRPGERTGNHWRLTMGEHGQGLRLVQFDPDAWKTILHGALTVPLGGPTGLSLFGKSAGVHQMFADHCEAETANPVTLRGATFDKWTVRPDRPDNHLLDCLVGAAVAASVAGLALTAGDTAPPAKKASGGKRRGSEIQREKMAKRMG